MQNQSFERSWNNSLITALIKTSEPCALSSMGEMMELEYREIPVMKKRVNWEPETAQNLNHSVKGRSKGSKGSSNEVKNELVINQTHENKDIFQGNPN